MLQGRTHDEACNIKKTLRIMVFLGKGSLCIVTEDIGWISLMEDNIHVEK